MPQASKNIISLALAVTCIVIFQIAELSDIFQAIVKQLTTDPSYSSLTLYQYYQPQMLYSEHLQRIHFFSHTPVLI